MRKFLVKIATDPRIQIQIQWIAWRPKTAIFRNPKSGGVDVKFFYKPYTVCDICWKRVDTGKEGEKELPVGYVLADTEYLYDVIICENCRRRYYRKLSVYDTLEEAERK
jgi:hypothetical protein